jgi:GAF domain-containing protein
VNPAAQTPNEEALAQARQTIAEQAAEIERLRRELGGETVARQLRDVLSLAATAGTIAAPSTYSRLIEMIVETAAHVINARSAALFLCEEDSDDLVLEFPLGPKAEAVRKLRVPRGYGIAGLVAANGQAMAVADAQNDPRQAADIAQTVGYVPQSILCVPLIHNEEVIGVLELLDKEDAPAFSPADMTALGFFANQAAIAIEQSRAHQSLAALAGELLESFVQLEEADRRRWREQLRTFAADVGSTATYRQAIELARLVQEIAHHGDGEDELRTCQVILRGFADYLKRRAEPAAELWAIR